MTRPRAAITAAVVALALVGAWFVGRGDVVSVDDPPAGDREAPGAIDPAWPEAALAGQGRAKPDAAAAAARRILGTPKPVEGASIRGIVVDGAGVAVAGARVVAIPDTATKFLAIEAVGAEGGTGAENFTDAQGRFVVAAVGDAPVYGVVVQADGYALTTKPSVRVGEEVRLELGAGVRLSGRVLTIDGEPVPGASVRVAMTVDLAAVEWTVTSGADGGFAVERLPSPLDRTRHAPTRRFVISVAREGFAHLAVTSHPSARSGRLDDLTLDLVLIRGATLMGDVLDAAAGTPIAGARIVLWAVDEWSTRSPRSGRALSSPWATRVVGEATSGADGSFRIDHVPATGFHGFGTYLSGQRGRLMGLVSAGKPGMTWESAEVPLTADGSIVEASIRLRPAATIVGRVVTPEGDPVPDMLVNVPRGRWERYGVISPPEVVASSGIYGQFSGADGTYRLAAVPVSASGPTRLRVTASVVGRVPTTSDPVEVDAAAGGVVRAPDIVIRRRDAASGQDDRSPVLLVRDADGRPIAGAVAHLRVRDRYDPSPVGHSARDGLLRVHADASDARRDAPAMRALVVSARGFAPAAVDVPADAVPGVTLPVTLGPAHRLAGRLRRADGVPTHECWIAVYDGAIPVAHLKSPGRSPGWISRSRRMPDTSQALLAHVRSEADGSFTIEDLPSGPYHVVGTLATVDARRVAAPPPALAESVPTDATDLDLVFPTPAEPEGGRILGTAVDDSTDLPIGTITVIATRRREADDPPPAPTRFLDDDGTETYVSAVGPHIQMASPGRFEATGVDVGTYDLDVTAPGYVAARIEAVVVSTRDVELPTVRLSRGIRIHGRLRLPSGEAPGDRTLELLASNASTAEPAAQLELHRAGTYELSGLVAGAYRVVVHANGFGGALLRADDRPIVLETGQTDVEVDLVLVPATILSTELTDPRLEPRDRGSAIVDPAFGARCALTVSRADGTLLARSRSLEHGIPWRISSLPVLRGDYVVRLEGPDDVGAEKRVSVGLETYVEVELGRPANR